MALKILIIVAFLVALASTAHAQPFILFSRSRASKRRARCARLEREKAHVECVLNRTEIGILHSEYMFLGKLFWQTRFWTFINVHF